MMLTRRACLSVTGLSVTGLAGAAALVGPDRSYAASSPRHGGTLTIAFRDDIATLDPAIGYDFQNWALIRALFCGLMDYEPGTTTLRPGLAETVSLSPDALVYRFSLRRGVRFHHGREVTAADAVYSLRRTIHPATQSPGQSFYAAIEGFGPFIAGETQELPGLSAPDPHTVVIRLSRPYAPFLHALALNFASVVPRDMVERYGADFGRHPVGCGAFRFDTWRIGQSVVLRRYEGYYEPGLPYLDRIIAEIGQEPLTAMLRLERGEIDVVGDGIPPARLNAIRRDPRFQGLIGIRPRLATTYLAMNVTKPPFDTLRVRQAVAHAIDKSRIVRLINGRGAPTDQIFPRGLPGYDPSFSGPVYDPARARSLLREAGWKDGFQTDLMTAATDPNPRIAQALQQDLEAIGIRASLRVLARPAMIEAACSGTGAPLIWSGDTGWSADFPDPSDFYGPILSVAASAPGGWNWARYRNAGIDALAAEADAMAAPSQAPARLKRWQAIQAAILADQPWVPLYNPLFFVPHTARIQGAEALFTDPVVTPVNFMHVYAVEG
ncbi:ABC transporter substrate-binding protein [Granulibacter bethesdensis]|uniref:ABC transporter substrate-binding protein n=1 Tax=Granulibacter bethesdensis TaxID=364410 RepID=UPI0003F1DABF|nr:ABC transporter substrate-binding protein [Granulibacter bethesdensis]AHJ64495.1 Amide-urea binding protein [Granulibacter bethesdensis CGDNIH4]